MPCVNSKHCFRPVILTCVLCKYRTDCACFVASGCHAGQVDGLRSQVGYQVVWCDTHLLMVMRMKLRFCTTHLHLSRYPIFRFLHLFEEIARTSLLNCTFFGRLFQHDRKSETPRISHILIRKKARKFKNSKISPENVCSCNF